ncbi:TetR family transcriptional regulator C-terminal domain-containing protein [Paraburkholderia sp. MPAMCS5]|uniref:TetR/AcrR family transcriptional regulator n=1 Tax=Paraburkholderia sp. MPAMCS5 TaxID=3112563 RepID=UPI002E18706C|nr:TetR family transcriptional regulator C-terminal domain-containing protein [Paraburkholderia sp. MPAMCS5]
MESQATVARRGPKPKANTRDALLRAGVQMFHERGYTATGVKDIVEAAEVPKGSFYTHFDSKESFGRDVVDSYFDSGLEDLHALLTNERVPPIERLRAYFEDRIRGYRATGYVRGCLMGNLSLEIADHSAPIRSRIAVHFRTWSGFFENCIAEAQRSGAIRNQLPASVLAEFVLNCWEGALLRMRAEKNGRPLIDFTEVVFGAILV